MKHLRNVEKQMAFVKKGSRFDSSNYRPVSLTSVCYKLMEGIIRDKIMKYLEDSV